MFPNYRPTSRGIVVVGDHELSLAALLTARGIDRRSVFFCSGGRDAVRLASVQPVDAFLLETQLPDMTAFDCVELLGDRCRLARFAILATAFSTLEERRCYLLPRTNYLCRPLSAELIESFLLPGARIRHADGRTRDEHRPGTARDPPGA